jgi:hypothetical protein
MAGRSCQSKVTPRVFIYPLNYSLVQRPPVWRNVRTFAKWVEDSPFHEVDGDCADYFLVPSHPPGGDAHGGDAAVARLFDDIRTRWPYWNRTVERGIARHFWLLPGDHGPGDSGYSRPAFPNKYSGPRPRRRPGQDNPTTADGERVDQYVWRTWGAGWEALNPASPARLLFFLTYHGLPDGLTKPSGGCFICFQPGLDIRLPQPENHECGPLCGLHRDIAGAHVPTAIQRALLASRSVRGMPAEGVSVKGRAAAPVQSTAGVGTAGAGVISGQKDTSPHTLPPARRLNSVSRDWPGEGEWPGQRGQRGGRGRLKQAALGVSPGALVGSAERGGGGGTARSRRGRVRAVTQPVAAHASARTGKLASASAHMAGAVRASRAGGVAGSKQNAARQAVDTESAPPGRVGARAGTGTQVESAAVQFGLDGWPRQHPSRNCTLYWAGTVRGRNNPVRSDAVAMLAKAAGECRRASGFGLGWAENRTGLWDRGDGRCGLASAVGAMRAFIGDAQLFFLCSTA